MSFFWVFFSRILTVRSADEFYCAMGQLSSEMLAYGVVDTNRLVKVTKIFFKLCIYFKTGLKNLS